ASTEPNVLVWIVITGAFACAAGAAISAIAAATRRTRLRLMSVPSRRRAIRYMSGARLDDVARIGPLGAFAHLELDLRTFGQALEALPGDVRVVDEDVLRPVLGLDEPVALGVVEPLDGSGCHQKNTSLARSRTGMKALRAQAELVLAGAGTLAATRE